MGYNKFQDRDGVVFLDLTEDTVTESDVLEGVTFHKADGTEAVGTLVAGSNPLEATDDSTMEALLVSENVGKVAQFNGTSDTYVDGGYYLIESAISLISFTIGGDTYQAEEGMTWGEWVDSGYSNNEFVTSASNIRSRTNVALYVYLNNSRVLTTDVITANIAYDLFNSSSMD